MSRGSTVRAFPLLILFVGLAGAAYLGRKWILPAPEVVLPPDSRDLDATVRDSALGQVEKVRRSPRDAAERGRLAMIYEANQLWDEAARSYGNALRLDPGNALWRYHRAIALDAAGDSEQAFEILRQAASELSEEAAPRERLGLMYLQRGDLDQAEASFQDALRIDPENPQLLVDIADVAIGRGDYAEARRHLLRALSLQPDFKPAHYSMGIALRQMGMRGEAERELALGLNAVHSYLPDPLSPQLARCAINYESQMDQASKLALAGEYQAAANILEAVLRKRPGDPYALNNLSAAYVGLGDFERAEDLLQRALANNAEDFAARINLSECRLKMGLAEQALSDADAAIRLAPEVSRAHYARARALSALGLFNDAYDSLRDTIDRDAHFDQAHMALGEVCMRLGREPEAVRHFQTAVRFNPNLLPALVNLGTLLLKRGALDDAERFLLQAETLAGQHPRVLALRRKLDHARR